MMKKVVILLFFLCASLEVRTTQDAILHAQAHACMVCGNIDRLLNVNSGQACHAFLCALCYSDHWDQPALRDTQTGQIYWNFECSHCAQTVRFYSTVAYDRYLSEDGDREY